MKKNKFSSLDALQDLKRIRNNLSAAPSTTRAAESTPAPKKNEFKTLIQTTKQNSKATPLNENDKALFLRAVHDVTPLRTSNKHGITTKSSLTTQQDAFRLRRQNALGYEKLSTLHHTSDIFLPEDVTRLHEYINPICGPDVLRKLKKGRWPIVNSIDLHGATLDQARLRLDYFLKHSLAEGFKCVRIVHGKGYGSKASGPVLPTIVRKWLAQLDFVLAFSDCAPNEGGSGAVKILLRTSVVLDES